MKYIFFFFIGSLFASDNQADKNDPFKQPQPLPVRRPFSSKKKIFMSGEYTRKELPDFGKGIIPLVPAQTGKTEEKIEDEQAK